jgi:hypothetical protein
VSPFPPWRAGVLASPREGQIKRIPTRDLRHDALALLSLLERDALL